MAPRKTATETPTAEAQVPTCKCGCGEPVNPKRNFRQGHDQVLISNLADNVVNGNPPNGLGLLKVTQAKKSVEERIQMVAEVMTLRLSEALSAKFESAANRQLAIKTRAGERKAPAKDAPKAPRKSRAKSATRTPTPASEVTETITEPQDEASGDGVVASRRIGPAHTARLGLGARIQIKVRGKVVDADVAAMNQAGKVTVATYVGAKGAERRVENPIVVTPESVAEDAE